MSHRIEANAEPDDRRRTARAGTCGCALLSFRSASGFTLSASALPSVTLYSFFTPFIRRNSKLKKLEILFSVIEMPVMLNFANFCCAFREDREEYLRSSRVYFHSLWPARLRGPGVSSSLLLIFTSCFIACLAEVSFTIPVLNGRGIFNYRAGGALADSAEYIRRNPSGVRGSLNYQFGSPSNCWSLRSRWICGTASKGGPRAFGLS